MSRTLYSISSGTERTQSAFVDTHRGCRGQIFSGERLSPWACFQTHQSFASTIRDMPPSYKLLRHAAKQPIFVRPFTPRSTQPRRLAMP